MFPRIIILILFVTVSQWAKTADSKLAREPNANRIQFEKVETLSFDFDKVPLKKVKKVLLHQGGIYILDSDRSEIYVLDKQGNYLRTIGRVGQGPGDLENPVDFFISHDNMIYVLNSMPRRIEVFNTMGKSIRSFKLETRSVYSFPGSLIVDQQGNIITGQGLNELILLYSPKGEYRKTILSRRNPVDESTLNVGILSQLGIIGPNQDILHFDQFKGTVTVVNQAGNTKFTLNPYVDDQFKTDMKKAEGYFKKLPKKNHASIMGIKFWTNFCTDNQGFIYLMPLTNPKKSDRIMLVYSMDGRHRYVKKLDFLKGKQILNMSCDNESFLFRTINLELILALRRKK